ncbi:hypothetical protein [Agrilutibacter solisilvae]|uniref:Uncharacterized protein n=1 Tax=Agrilutibacter solisilvae TaxID=2763317 RepID=A0A974XYG8_9GAMM|nr:hypothetical protein [Lysobacter solisilvae]QSX78116.1 hypothetical protein I8J32_015675 [Lysobacter solisilvae]
MSDKTNRPEPGTDEYDLAMVRKFRAQQGSEEAPLADLGIGIRQTPNGPISVQMRPNESVTHGDPTGGAAGISPAAAAHQVELIRSEIARLREELEERSTILDPDTGQARFYHQGGNRTFREVRLRQLEEATLPHALMVHQAAIEAQAAQPTLEESLLAEKDRQAAKRVRAEEIVADQEAVDSATRIYEQRRNSRRG